MGAIKRDPNNPGTLIIQYWRCKCQVPLVGAELLRQTRQMREVIAKVGNITHSDSRDRGRRRRGMTPTRTAAE